MAIEEHRNNTDDAKCVSGLVKRKQKRRKNRKKENLGKFLKDSK